MARDSRSPSSASTGPRRHPRRPRAGARTSSPAGPDAEAASPAAEPRRLPVLGLGAKVTGRALALVVVLALLGLSYASSLRIYLDQQHELAVATQEINERKAEVADLESQLDRWDDPAYVKAQARDRLGWVMPGETGYRVIGEDGTPLGGGAVIESELPSAGDEQESMWWDRMWGSIRTADAPVRKVTNR